MLNGGGNEDGKNIKKSNKPKKHFWCIFFLLILHDNNAAVLRDSKVKLSSYTLFFYEGNCRDVITRTLVVCIPVCFYFSLPLIFTLLAALYWPLAFLIFSPPLRHFHIFLPTKFVSFVLNHLH